MKKTELYLLYGLNLAMRNIASNEPCLFKRLLLESLDELQIPIVDKTTDNCNRVYIDFSTIKKLKNTKEFIWFTEVIYEIFSKLHTASGELIIEEIIVLKNYTIIKLKE